MSLLQQVMKDKWINSGYEGDDLKPHIEPVEDYSDPNRIGEADSPALPAAKQLHADLLLTVTCVSCSSEVMVGMGFTPEEIKDSLLNQKYNEVTATYLLLGRKGDVSFSSAQPLLFIVTITRATRKRISYHADYDEV